MLFLGIIGGLVLALLIFDVTQKKNAIWHNFPLIGHGRNLLIELGPELRQYIVANNREESPFNRSEREWIYHSAKRENNYFGFGTDDQVYNIGYPVIKHAMFPYGKKAIPVASTIITRTYRALRLSVRHTVAKTIPARIHH